jgi:DNA polymerase-4
VPRLRDRPIAVVPVMTSSTCCIAASYEAKALGIKTGTPVSEAIRRCPNIELVEGRQDLYVRYHQRVVDAVEDCLHVDQICSIDEMYCKLMAGEREVDAAVAIARKVKDAIKQQVGRCMRCSVGIGPSVWLAKVASDLQKPDGLTVVRREDMPHALHHLKLDDLPGIGWRMLQRLNRQGVHQISELCQMTVEQLSSIWKSSVHGEIWWHQLRGLDLSARATRRRTVGHSHVLAPALRTTEGAHAVLIRMIHKAAMRLRRLNHWAGRMDVSVRLDDGTRWHRHLSLGTCRDTLTMLQGFEQLWRQQPRGIPKKVGVVLSDLTPNDAAGTLHFQDQLRRGAVADIMDRLDKKYGHHTLYFGGMFGAQRAAPTRIAFTQIPDLEDF